MHTRRAFLQTILVTAASRWTERIGSASPHKYPKDFVSWAGERLEYQLDCPFLPRIATGTLHFERIGESLTFLAALETRIQGVLGAITLQRRDLFASLMSWSDSHRRFLSQWYAEQVSRKGSWKRKVLIFRHARNKYIEHRIYPHRTRRRPRKCGGRILDDPLSAYYNWRVGAFGPLGPGCSHRIDNLARKDPFVLDIHTASPEEARLRRAEKPLTYPKAHFLRARLDKELLDLIGGEVVGWADESWVPVCGRATRVKWVGEVTASLLRKDRLPGPGRALCPPPPVEQSPWTISADAYESNQPRCIGRSGG